MISFFPSSRGQLFSLDVILAAVLFTLALGMLLNQSELWISSQHQRTETQELHELALLASNALVSNPDLNASFASTTVNLRCAPPEWAAHNDISWVENCMWVDPAQSYSLSSSGLGIPPGYGFKIRFSNSAQTIPFTPVGAPTIPAGVAFQTIDRNMLVFSSNPSSTTLANCFSVGCASNIQIVHISVWRNP